MKHALAVLAGLAVGLPGMAALASIDGHATGGLPDRFVLWAQGGRHLRTGIIPGGTPEPRHRHREGRWALERSRSRAPSPATGLPESSPAPARMPPGERLTGRAERLNGVRVWIDAPRTVRPGGTYTYRIRLANRGSGTPGDITVRNLLPAGVVRTGASLPDGVGGYAGGRDTTLVMPRLAPGRSATARFVVRVRPNTHGDLVARSRIASIGGARVPRSAGTTSRVSTRIR